MPLSQGDGVSRLLVRGLIAGVVAAILAFGVASVMGEPPLEAAIAFEDHAAHSLGEHAHTETVPRAVQSTAGLGLGLLIIGVVFGGLFGLVFASVQGRLDSLRVRGTTFAVAVTCFVVMVVAPAIKYPANPPGSSDAGTIGPRTQAYFAAMAVAAIVVFSGFVIRALLARRLGGRVSTVLAALLCTGLLWVTLAMLPTYDEVPRTFPDGVLTQFRAAFWAVQVTLWGCIALAFGLLTQRRMRHLATPHQRR